MTGDAVRLVQFEDEAGRLRVGRVHADGRSVAVLPDGTSTRELALQAWRQQIGLAALVQSLPVAEELAYALLLGSGRMLPPLTHPDPHRCLVSGTGLTHLGSAAARDRMHQQAAATAAAGEAVTDSARMFQWGLEGGKPAGRGPGVQPEWFYKGNGSILVGCGRPIVAPAFALDHGEEPELVGLYVVAPDGTPLRLGHALGNEFSDHVTERANYLYLAHSKLRQCSVGPELRTGALPGHLEGMSRIRRGAALHWEKPFLTGEDNMSHSLANLEYHHFKYAAHRIPGDVHLHFFGTATLSFADGIRVGPGDVFEIELPALGAALVNPLRVAPPDFVPHAVVAL
jgi:hypothetical protein